jgi:hypothetical protein
MATYTLLELVDLVLSSIDGDEIDSINDTTESKQVVKIIKTVYNDIISRVDLPEHNSLFQLTETSSSTPTIMTLPTAVNRLDWIRYNMETADDTDDAFKPVKFMELRDFLDMMYMRDESDTDVHGTFTYSVDGTTTKFFYGVASSPQWYTQISDNVLLFDAVDEEVEEFLRTTKTSCGGQLEPTFTEDDAFTPDLDTPQFSLLVNECKALAWAELRQSQHVKAEVNAKRGWTKLQIGKERVQDRTAYSQVKGYGRK